MVFVFRIFIYRDAHFLISGFVNEDLSNFFSLKDLFQKLLHPHHSMSTFHQISYNNYLKWFPQAMSGLPGYLLILTLKRNYLIVSLFSNFRNRLVIFILSFCFFFCFLYALFKSQAFIFTWCQFFSQKIHLFSLGLIKSFGCVQTNSLIIDIFLVRGNFDISLFFL